MTYRDDPLNADVVDHATAATTATELAVFRQAFAGDAAAWTTLYCRYTYLMRYWVGGSSLVDPDVVVQDAWFAFARYAPRQPSLVQDGALSHVLSYLRHCVTTATIDQYRREQRHTATVPLTAQATDPAVPGYGIEGTVVQRLLLQERIPQILETAEEQFLFQVRFVWGIPPRTIVATYPARFPDVQTVYTQVERLVQRLRADPVLQALRTGA